MIDAETISLIANIIFYVLIGIVFVKSLMGLKKGLWKTIVSFIVSTILYVLLIIYNAQLTEIYYNIDISKYFDIIIALDNKEITVTTIGQTLRDVIIYFASSETGVNLSSEALQVCDALAKSILAFMVFVVHIILTVFIIVPLVSSLIYHLIVKPILGKNITKKHKVRIGGFLLGGVKATLTSALLLTPFSALVNRVADVASDRSFSGDVAIVTDYVNAYNDSALAKLFSNIRINGRSFDIFIADYVTTIDYGNNHASSFLNEVEMLADILCDGIEQGIIDIQTFEIDYTKVLSEVFVTKVLTKLAESPLVTAILPVTLSIVANLDQIKENVDLTAVNWQAIEWGDELNLLSSIYDTFYDTGLVDKVFDLESLYGYELSRDVYPHFKATFQQLNNSNVLNSVMPYILSSFGKYLEETDFKGIFPTEVEYYQMINIGEELSVIFDSLMTISDLSSYIFDDSTIVNQTPLQKRMSKNEERHFLTIGDLVDETKRTQIIDFLLSKDAIQGTYQENGLDYYYISSDGSNKINTISVFNGVYDENGVEAYKGLIDSNIIGGNMGSLLEYVVNSNEEIKKLNIQDAIKEVGTIENYDWKNEIDSLLNIVSIVYKNEYLTLDENFDIFDENVTNELKKITPYMDKSDLVRRLANPLITSFLGDRDIMGLKASDLYFGSSNDTQFKLGQELNNLLNILPQVGSVMDSFSTENNKFSLYVLFDENSTLSTDLKHVLESVYNSKILNPNANNANSLNNFEKVIKNLMNNFKDMGFKELTDDFLLKIRNNSGWIGDTGEITAICDAFGNLKNLKSIKDIINKVNNGQEGETITISISEIDSNDIKQLIEGFSSSQIINNSLGNICNKYFAPTMDNTGIKVDFNNVESWEQEADSLCSIIDIIKNISENNEGISISFENFDLSSLNYQNADGSDGADDIGKLFKSLYKLQSIQEKITDSEGQEKLINNFGSIVFNFTEKFLSDLKLNQEVLNEIKLDFEFDNNNKHDSAIVWCTEDGNIPLDKNGDYLPGVSVIDDIVVLIRDLSQDNSLFDENGKINISAAFDDETLIGSLEKIVLDINNIYVLRSAIEPILENNLTLDINSLDLKKLNIAVFSNEYNYLSTYNIELNANAITTRSEEINLRKTELKNIFSIVDNINQMKSFKGEGIGKFRNDDTHTDKIGVVENILLDCQQSKLFNTVNPNYETQNTTNLFEDIVYVLIDNSGLSSMIGNGIVSNDIFVKGLISDISSSNKGLSWKEEINKFCTALESIVNLDDKNGNAFTSLDQFGNIDGDKIGAILNNLNHSYLCHTMVGNAINSIYEQLGVKDLSLDPMNNPIDARLIDQKEDLLFTEKVSLWDEDIEHIVDLYKIFNGRNIEEILNKENIEEGIFSQILPDFVVLNHLENSKNDIIYSVFDKVGVSELISGNNPSEKSQRISQLTSYLLTEDEWRTLEASRLDSIINDLRTMNSNNNLNLYDIDASLITKVLENTFVYIENNSIEERYQRGFLASEIVSSLIDRISKNIDESIQFSWKTDNFKVINRFEIDGLRGTIEMINDLVVLCDIIDNRDESRYNSWKNDFKEHMTLMGSELLEGEPLYAEKNYYLGQHNSQAALSLYKIMIQNNTQIDNAYVKNLPYDLKENQTFEQKADELISNLDLLISSIS